MIGTWDEVMTNKPTEWLPKAGRSESVTKKSWSLGGRFIRMEGVWMPAKTKFLSLVSYDLATKLFPGGLFELLLLQDHMEPGAVGLGQRVGIRRRADPETHMCPRLLLGSCNDVAR